MGMKSFYPKGNWVKRKSKIKESVENLIKWAFEKTVNKSWQNRWEATKKKSFHLKSLENIGKSSIIVCFVNENKVL